MALAEHAVRRKGAVVRVPGGRVDGGQQVLALVYLDLAFADGHIERWISSGTSRLSRPGDELEQLVRWAETDVVEVMGVDLLEEVAADLGHDVSAAFDAAPTEIVVEWNRTGH